VTSSPAGDWLMVDALELSRWDRELLLELREGNVSCVHVTCAFWESARDTLSRLGQMLSLIRTNADLVTHVRSVADIEDARRSARTGIMLGFQNASPLEDDIELAGAFHALGVRVVQLTYNNQNHVGSSCYESGDAGLSRFGRLVIGELNELGMAIDLSHVGDRTSLEAIELSQAPVAITHANPRWFHDVPRNRPDDVLHACAARGGVVGVCIYPLVLPQGAGRDWPQFRDMLLRLADQIGVEHVGIGTDFARKQPSEFLAWLRAGRWTRQPQDVGEPAWPEWLPSPAAFPQLAGRLLDAGFSDGEARGIMGENWLRFFRTVFQEEAACT
jgi:membrane dipeptidase